MRLHADAAAASTVAPCTSASGLPFFPFAGVWS